MNSSEKKRVLKIFSLLEKEYPSVKSALNFANPFELLIATILSAQCTDVRVNIVTKDLFRKYKIPEDFLLIPDEVLEKEIYSTGFYKQKTKSIKKCCQVLVDEYKSRVPADFEKLSNLPGVGRKTASVVAGNAFGIPAIAVDTHVMRLSNLLGIIDSKDPVKIETRLKEILPEDQWINASHLLIYHGRKVCIARRPRCGECVVKKLCPAYQLIFRKD
jgi:endonuclease III